MQNQTKWRNSIRPRLAGINLDLHLGKNSILRFIFTRVCAYTLPPVRRRESLKRWDRKVPVCFLFQLRLGIILAQVFSRHSAQCIPKDTERERTKDLKRKQLYSCATHIFASHIHNAKLRCTVAHHYRVNEVPLDEFKATMFSQQNGRGKSTFAIDIQLSILNICHVFTSGLQICWSRNHMR